MYAVLLKDIAETGKVALARVVIGQRERAIGLVAYALDEQRDINGARSILGDVAEIRTPQRWCNWPSNSSIARHRRMIGLTWRIVTRPASCND